MSEIHNESVTLDCGCEIPLVNGKPHIDFHNLKLDCPKVWEIYKKGHTNSVFQLNSFLGKKYSKEMEPNSIDDAAALISIIRPATLNSKDKNGKSLTQKVCDIKTGAEEKDPDNPLAEIAKDTYGLIYYQESIILLAVELAGFSKVDALKFMKTTAKKNAEALFAFEKQFLDGCKSIGKVSDNDARLIFENIKNASRYCFNKCFSGKEKIKRMGNGGRYHPTIEEMYNIKNNRNYAVKNNKYQLWKKYRKNGYGQALSMSKDGRIYPNQIKDIRYEGVREIYEMTLESGEKSLTTKNHKFPTPNGDIKLEDLKKGDEIYLCGKYEKQKINYSFSDVTTEERLKKKGKSGHNTHGSQNRMFVNGEWTKFNEARKNLPQKCNSCGVSGKYNRIETHHIDGDRSNNDISNFEKLCPSCHKKADYQLGRTKRGERGYPSLLSKIKSIELIETGNVYDVEMEAPDHNLVLDSGVVSCNSHATAYAILGYQMAWAVTHLPKHFICAQLMHAKNAPSTQEEIRKIASEARRLSIDIKPPSAKFLPATGFFIDKNNIHYALNTIKGCGEKSFTKLNKLDLDIESMNWIEFLIFASDALNKKQAKNMIKTGCFDFMDISRRGAEYEYDQWNLLTKTEKKKIADSYETLLFSDLLEAVESLEPTTKRLDIVNSIKYGLISPSMSLDDSITNIVDNEREILGINLTCSKVEKSNVPKMTDKCQDVQSRMKEYYTLIGEISEYREFKIKNGKMKGQFMACFKLNDESDECDVVVFPDQLSKFEACLFDGNVCVLEGKISNSGSGLIINKIYEI